ncbi:MAG TPA: DNA alkylation repair protein, partial [archaeon]|nr:DNA alkylation repair protein [archaeon]
MEYSEIISRLESLANPANLAGMARFGITARKAYGISNTVLKKFAREVGKSHELAQKLWEAGCHETKLLAALVDEPKLVTPEQMEAWAGGFENWAECDSVCGYLFTKTPFAWEKAVEWSGRQEEFVKRAGFAMMAWLAVQDKKAADEKFMKLLPIIWRESTDERNFIRKAVNWALRQIGKRNGRLHKLALETAEEILSL